MAPYVEAIGYWRDVLGTSPALLLRSRLWWLSSVSEVFRQGTLCEYAWSPLSGVRFRTNLSFAPDRLACESRKFWDRSQKLGWQAVFQPPPEAPTRLRFPSV